jgi:hypothetical protein
VRFDSHLDLIEPAELDAVPIGELLDAMDAFWTATRDGDNGRPHTVITEVEPERQRELRFMPYPEFLQTIEWSNTRYQMLAVANWKCEECGFGGIGKRLDVHHLTYERRGAELYSDLVVLCQRCHYACHRMFGP